MSKHPKVVHLTRAKPSQSLSAVTLALATACAISTPLQSTAADTNQVSPEFVRQILDRLDKDEAELKKVRAQLSNSLPNLSQTTTGTVQMPAPQIDQRLNKQDEQIKSLSDQLSQAEAAKAKPTYPNLQFHGFGDVDYSADTRKAINVPGNVGGIPYGVGYYGIKNTFYLGELDFFITSQLGENTSVVTEDAVSAGSDNHTGIDVERLYLEQRVNDYFNVDVGRFHTDLGYYNTTYHHGTYLQTAINRPTFLEFEDSGGILPDHMVGVSMYGAIPSGKLNLSYHVEFGNGEEFSANPNLNSVQQLLSFTDSKAVNLALEAKPDWKPGLQFGANLYYDSIKPDNANTTNNVPRNDQFILGANLIYNSAKWEFLNEGYLIMDKPVGGQTHYDPAFYTQLGYKAGVLTPYARFNYYHIGLNDTLYTLDWAGGVNAGSHYGPSLGLRYDFNTYAAFKLQYDYLIDHGYNSASRINLQLCFTF
jgi:hypothetical protein